MGFTSYFIAIPLPDQFQTQFEKLLSDIQNMGLQVRTVYPKTPHITLLYLGKQEKNSLKLLKALLIKEKVKDVTDINLSVGGLGTFKKEGYEVLFLNVDYSPELVDLHNNLTRKLLEFLPTDLFLNQNTQLFHPHMTVGGLTDSDNQLKGLITSKMSEINWAFPVTEIAIFGADSTQTPEYQEKLISIPH